MKYIALIKVEQNESGLELDYADAIRTVIRQPMNMQIGVHLEEMRKGIRVLNALDESVDVLALEDSDWEHLKEKIEAMAWGSVDRHILAFVEAVLTAPSKTPTNGLVVEVPSRV